MAEPLSPKSSSSTFVVVNRSREHMDDELLKTLHHVKALDKFGKDLQKTKSQIEFYTTDKPPLFSNHELSQKVVTTNKGDIKSKDKYKFMFNKDMQLKVTEFFPTKGKGLNFVKTSEKVK